MAAGKFITFEGGEGVGKSTQAKLLVAALAQRGIDAILTREPGGSPFAERVRAMLLDPTTPPHGSAGGLEPEVLEALDRLVVRGQQPDLTVVLDLDPREGLARVTRRRAPTPSPDLADPFEGRDLSFHQRLRAGYLALAQAESQRCVVIDATLAPESIAGAVWQAVAGRLLAGGG
jgi:dTMP kinase